MSNTIRTPEYRFFSFSFTYFGKAFLGCAENVCMRV